MVRARRSVRQVARLADHRTKEVFVRKPLMILAAFAVCVATSAFTSAYFAYTNVAKIGPFYTTSHAFDSLKSRQVGGAVVTHTVAASESVSVGDVVYITGTAMTIKRDTILANYTRIAGVVVGGQRTNMQGAIDSTNVGTLAATGGQKALVLVRGRAWVTVDTITGGISAGSTLIPSNRQGQRGRVTAKTTAIDSFYRKVGQIPDSGVAGRRAVVNVNIK